MIDLRLGNCLDLLPTIPDRSVDVVLTDPPYAEISRPYGRLTEAQWHELMNAVVVECRRILKPTGSAVFVLQPNSEKVGRMRPWLWEFMAKWTREWNMVQDCWWWNHAAAPTIHCQRKHRLMRPSVKPCVWLGEPDCFRDQDEVLWKESDWSKTRRTSDRASGLNRGRVSTPSGHSVNAVAIYDVAEKRGGTTPFNVIMADNGYAQRSAASHGHGAGTPHHLADWWVRYISPPNGIVLDPFMGSGTIPLAALARGRSVIGFESMPGYFAIAEQRITQESEKYLLLGSA